MAPTFEILAYEPTELGILCLRRRELLSEPGTLVTEVTLDHEFLMSSYHTASERALATIGVQMHGGRALDVMVGGLGLGYTAEAMLDCEAVARVEVVELLEPVIGWLNQGLIPLSEKLLADPRCVVSQDDVYQRLSLEPRRYYDLIAIDVDHSPEDHLNHQNHAFYTAAGVQRAKTHLNPHGILGVWSYAEDTPFLAALQQVFKEVRVEPVTFRNFHIDETVTDWLYFARD